MPELPVPSPRVERVYCNSCGRETRHEVLFTVNTKDTEMVDDEFEVGWYHHHGVLKCLGCETVCLRLESYFSESGHGDPPQTTFYPPPLARRAPDWLEDVPESQQALLKEVYAALQADSRRLAVMGMRAVLDLYLVTKVEDRGTFTEKLTQLSEQGFIGVRQRDVLAAAIETGHAAAHRGYQPTQEAMQAVLDIVENLLQAELLHPTATALRAATPPRRAHREGG